MKPQATKSRDSAGCAPCPCQCCVHLRALNAAVLVAVLLPHLLLERVVQRLDALALGGVRRGAEHSPVGGGAGVWQRDAEVACEQLRAVMCSQCVSR